MVFKKELKNLLPKSGKKTDTSEYSGDPFKIVKITVLVGTIHFYPISFAIFFWGGFVCMFPYSINVFKNRK